MPNFLDKERVIKDLELLIKENYFIYGQVPKMAIAELLAQYKKEEGIRIIILYDCETNYLVETDASAEEIRKAIDYKNTMLENDDPAFRSDFEEMQTFLNKKGYHFEGLGYVGKYDHDIEEYYW